jgi:virulence-associated protein VapD
MMRKIKFYGFDLDLKIYNEKVFKDYFRDFRFLAKKGFLGYQGATKVEKYTDRMLFEYFSVIYLSKKLSSLKEIGWEDCDSDISVLDNYVEGLIKKQALPTIWSEELLQYYFATASVAKVKKLIKKWDLDNIAKSHKKRGRVADWLRAVQFGLFDKGVLRKKELFKKLYYRNLLSYSQNPYINHPEKIDKWVADRMFPYFREDYKEKFQIL